MYSQCGHRQYSSVIGGAPGDTNWLNLEMHLEAVVAGKSILHHCSNSVWLGEDSRGHTDTGITEMDWGMGSWPSHVEETEQRGVDWVTRSTYLRDPGVDRHHLIIRNTHYIFPSSLPHTLLPRFDRSYRFVWFLTHSSWAFINPHTLCGSSWPGMPSYFLTLFLCYLSQNSYFSQISFRSSWSSTVSPHCDCVHLEMYLEVMIEPV